MIGFVGTARHSYIAGLTSHYERLETIAAPLLTDSEVKRSRAAFVLVTNRNAYLAVVNQLAKKIAESGTPPPIRDFL
jgi:hypothetical protein